MLCRFLFLLFPLSLAAQQPNVVLIFADDLGFSDIGCYGSEIQTPHIDSLAAEGLRFRSFYNTGRCSPSRASIMTGRYPQEVGVGHLDENWNTPGYMGRIDPNSPTVAETLSDAGYFTAISGKWHLGSQRPNWPIDRGFERMFSSPNGGGYYFRPFETANRPLFLNETQVDLDDWETDYNSGQPFYSTDAFTTMGLEFIDEALAAAKPFFLYLPYIAPHFPLEADEAEVLKYLNTDFKTTPPTSGTGTYSSGYEPVRTARLARQKSPGGIAHSLNGTAEEWQLSPRTGATWTSNATHEQRMALHAAVIERMDNQIGRVLAKLDDPNNDGNQSDSIANNTIVIFVSDNGCASSGGSTGAGTTNHPTYGSGTSGIKVGSTWANVSNTPFRRFKSSNQEGGIRTPFVIRWPNGISRANNEIETARAHLIDIVPTLLDCAGTSVPNTQPQPSGISLKPLFAPAGTITRNDPLFFEHEGERAIIDADGWKLFSQNNSAWELYHLPTDPQELNDLSAPEAARVSTMSDAWFAWAHDANVKDYPPTSLQRVTLTTDQNASLDSLQNGSVTLSRTTSSGNVDVHIEVQGSATPTTHYTPLNSIYPFSGNSAQTLSIVPNASTPLTAPKSVEIKIKPRYWYLEPVEPESVWINPTTFDQWKEEHLDGQSGLDATPLGDPDNDGAPNYQEFGRGTDPTSPDPQNEEISSPEISPDGTQATFSFLRAPASNEIAHIFEFSDDLKTWHPIDVSEITLSETTVDDRQLSTLVLSDDIQNEPRKFGRLGWSWTGATIGSSLITYQFPSGSPSPTVSQPGIVGSDFDPRSSSFPAGMSGLSSSNENAFLRSSATVNTLGDAIDNDHYHDVSIDFSSNPTDLISLRYDQVMINGAFTSNVTTYASTDNFASSTQIGTSTMTALGRSSFEFTLLPLQLTDFTGTLSLRFYIFDDVDLSNNISRLDNIQLNGFSNQAADTIADYPLLTNRASTDTHASIASDYLGGTLGTPPNASTNNTAHVYTLGSETLSSATHFFTLDPNGGSLDLSALTFNYLATNIDFNGSSFSYELTSSATGATILSSRTFSSSSGGTADFTSSESADLSAHPALQNLTTPITFTFTFTDNSSGSGRSHGISAITLTSAP